MTKKQWVFRTLLTNLFASTPAWVGPLCGLTGAALFLAGTVCFVAYNWAAWGALYKFALPLIGLLACAAGVYRTGLESNAGRVLSFACGLFIGLFWVVFGQVYQTGAFVYEFCLAWAISLLPLAMLAGNRWLWVLWAVVCNGYLVSYRSGWPDMRVLLIFNAGCFAVNEWAALRPGGKGGWISLFFLAAVLGCCLAEAFSHGWGVYFWMNTGWVILLGLYAWRFKRGAVQLGFCALVLDILLAARMLELLSQGLISLLAGPAVIVLFVCSAAAVYFLSREEKTNDR